jgi:hypothetical protein
VIVPCYSLKFLSKFVSLCCSCWRSRISAQQSWRSYRPLHLKFLPCLRYIASRSPSQERGVLDAIPLGPVGI